jgi:hypothetical protein
MKNWKTTLSALGVALGAIGKAIGEYSTGGFGAVDWGFLFTAIAGATGLSFAKDFNVSGTGK